MKIIKQNSNFTDTSKEQNNNWIDKLYELSGGDDNYGNCMVDVEKAIPIIKSEINKAIEQDHKRILESEVMKKEEGSSFGRTANRNELRQEIKLIINDKK